jgi:hypothetical protein
MQVAVVVGMACKIGGGGKTKRSFFNRCRVLSVVSTGGIGFTISFRSSLEQDTMKMMRKRKKTVDFDNRVVIFVF